MVDHGKESCEKEMVFYETEGREDGRLSHMSDSRAGIVAAATPTAAAPPSLIFVPPNPVSLHE
jgi:hypothetical protein